ncbi:MAG: DNA-processing protein DprA [Candidatus Cloacimonas sp.]
MDRFNAWICLKSAPLLGPKGVLEILQRYPDPQEFVGNPAHNIYREDKLKPETIKHLSNFVLPENSPKIVDLLAKYQIQYLCLTDPDYPACLKEICDPPLILYYRGDLLETLKDLCLAVVGTRKPTSYGVEMTRKILSPLCEKGVNIISGLAMGIDTIAHQTALKAKTKTIAVFASGLETIYPPMNKALAEHIMDNGALVSEYEPGSKLERWNFPARNRIISALSQAILVVEGSLNSGAMLTAKFAQQQNKPLFALPGNINNRNAQGPNLLIRQGATLVSSADDLITDFGLSSSVKEQLELIPELSAEEQSIFDLLSEAQRDITFDELLLKTGLGFGKLSTLLLNLELKGVIAKSSGNSYIKL